MADALNHPIDIEQIYRRYAPMVLRRCRQLLKNEENAVDAMQDVFARLLAYRDRLHVKFPSSLLFRMATNVCLNIIRSQKIRRTHGDMDILDSIATYDEQETRALGQVILEKLFRREKPTTREIAVLHFVDGLTLEEVAEEIGLSVSGVRKRLRDFQARAKKLQEA